MEKALNGDFTHKTLIILGRLDNLNDYTKANRGNKYGGNGMKQKNEEYITGFIEEQLKGIRFEGKVYLHFRWYEPNRNRDLDNVCFAKKFILDALVKNKIIETDGWRGVWGFTDEFDIDAFNPRIEVVIDGKLKKGEQL